MQLVWQTFAESLTRGRVLPRVEKGEGLPLAFRAVPAACPVGDRHPWDGDDSVAQQHSPATAKAPAEQEASVLE